MKHSIVVASLVVAGGLLAGPAQAELEVNEVGANATSLCQPALPAFDGLIRKRPLAVQNEGTSTAFVTCSFSTQYEAASIYRIGYFGAFMINNSTSPLVVSCTGVAGYAGNTGTGPAANQVLTKSVTLAPNSSGELFFSTTESSTGYYPLVNMSCLLPPGAGIGETLVGFSVDDAP